MIKLFNRYYSIKDILFFLIESFLIFVSVILAAYIRFKITNFWLSDYYAIGFKAMLITFICQLSLYYSDLYNTKIIRTRQETIIRSLQAIGVAAVILSIVYYAIPGLIIGRGIFLISIFILSITTITWRLFYSWTIDIKALDEKILIVGTGETAKDIAKRLLNKEKVGYNIVGFISVDDATLVGKSLVNPTVVGTYNDICGIVEREGISKIIVALSERRGRLPLDTLLRCRLNGIKIEDDSTFYEGINGKIRLESLRPSWLIFSDGFKKSWGSIVTKRLLDIVASLMLLIMMLPVMLLVAILIKLDSKGHVFFKQERIGQDGNIFTLLKFRSMREDAESGLGPVWAKKDDDRATKLGRILRKTRLDELPQLINVLKGDMSFVGPRPERPFFVEQLKEKIPYYSLRESVRPGVTGWAQICYPYGASVEDAYEKLQYDLYYIKNMSFLLDLTIIFETAKVVLLGRGSR
ncbi:MAG: TIGR03013 family PEP-CTERM/XrtA system glycosyltransferase [Nitrospirae bacterium]|nr:TIGR03013 family PEP-CTERM/XrtA system glycosyltransferase [Nitrospirota bacterium]